MAFIKSFWGRSVCLLCIPCIVGLVGCGDKTGIGKVVPVSGKVTVDGEPLTGGVVTFIPDTSKGNTSDFHPTGRIESDGTYVVKTSGWEGAEKEGAPVGPYKVTVSTQVPPSGATMMQDMDAGSQGADVHPKYTTPGSTDLAVEVIEGAAPGAYDLKLSK